MEFDKNCSEAFKDSQRNHKLGGFDV